MSHISKLFRISLFLFILLFKLGIQGSVLGQELDPINIMHYNLLRFGNNCDPVTINEKASWLETILNFYQPDIFTVNELLPEIAFENLIEEACQGYNPAMKAAGFTNEAGSEIVSDLFFNSELFGLSQIEVLPGAFRDIGVYTLFVKEGVGDRLDTTFLYCIVAHFKAGGSQDDASLRLEEAREVLSWMENREGLGNILFVGDLNFDNAREEAWLELIDPSNAFGFYDPIELTEDWNGPDFANVHTQSTRTTLPDCGVDGGLDDRFDFILVASDLLSGAGGLFANAESYQALGNGGEAFNQNLDCTGSTVPSILCNTLRQMSDHLPVVMELTPTVPVSRKGGFEAGQIEFVNPFSQFLNLKLSDLSFGDRLHIELYSLAGKRMYHEYVMGEMTEVKIPTESLPKGYYLLRISSDRGQLTVKKVLKH